VWVKESLKTVRSFFGQYTSVYLLSVRWGQHHGVSFEKQNKIKRDRGENKTPSKNFFGNRGAIFKEKK